MTSLQANRLVVLDRDGVINIDSDSYIKNAQEWIPIKGSLEAIAKLNQAGIDVVVVTNQSGLARKYFSPNDLDEMHLKMRSLLKPLGGNIRDIFYCPHLPTDNCDCRKPKTGLLDQLAIKYNLCLKRVPFIGDSEKDLIAAKSKDCTPILVKTGKGKAFYDAHSKDLKTTLVFEDLQGASQYLLDTHFR